MRKHNRGESKIGCIITLVIVAAIIYVGYKVGEAKWDYESMKEKVTEMTKFVAATKTPNLTLTKKSILDAADDLGIDLYEEDIEILIEKGYVTIDVYWDTPISVPGYTYYLEHSVSRTQKLRYTPDD